MISVWPSVRPCPSDVAAILLHVTNVSVSLCLMSFTRSCQSAVSDLDFILCSQRRPTFEIEGCVVLGTFKLCGIQLHDLVHAYVTHRLRHAYDAAFDFSAN